MRAVGLFFARVYTWVVFIPIFAVLTMLCGTFAWTLGFVSVRAGDVFGVIWGRAVVALAFVRVRVHGRREHLERGEDGMLIVRLKKPWADGTASFVFTPVELLARLAAILPPPNVNTVIYNRVLAGRNEWRAEVVPPPPEREKLGFLRLEGTPVPKRRWWVCSWAELLLRVFLSEGLLCPLCGKEMRVRAIVMPPATIRVLNGLRRAAERSPPAPPKTEATA